MASGILSSGFLVIWVRSSSWCSGLSQHVGVGTPPVSASSSSLSLCALCGRSWPPPHSFPPAAASQGIYRAHLSPLSSNILNILSTSKLDSRVHPFSPNLSHSFLSNWYRLTNCSERKHNGYLTSPNTSKCTFASTFVDSNLLDLLEHIFSVSPFS